MRMLEKGRRCGLLLAAVLTVGLVPLIAAPPAAAATDTFGSQPLDDVIAAAQAELDDPEPHCGLSRDQIVAIFMPLHDLAHAHDPGAAPAVLVEERRRRRARRGEALERRAVRLEAPERLGQVGHDRGRHRRQRAGERPGELRLVELARQLRLP